MAATVHKGDLAPSSGAGFQAAFGDLDAGLPLLLFPVRLETRFQPSVAPNELIVRIYPDDVQTDTHVRGLQPGEVEYGRAFWTAAWPRRADARRQRLDARFARMADRVGPFRAAFVLTATRPVNWETRASGGEPEFGPVTARDTVEPGRARLLPQRWIVVGYQGDGHAFTVAGARIVSDLAVSPDFAGSGAAPRDIGELLETQEISWVRDIAAAESVGMAVRVTLGETAWDPGEALDLYVLGVRADHDPAATAAGLDDLLAAHRWTHGLDFVRRGTPTNNTDTAVSGLSLSSPDLVALLDNVLEGSSGGAGDAARQVEPGPMTPGPSRPEPVPVPTVPRGVRDFGDAMATALGLGPDSVVRQVALHGDAQLRIASAMNAALWPATWGYLLRRLLGTAITAPDAEWIRDRFISYVPGGGALPSLRLGRQPYGVLPVMYDRAGSQPSPQAERLLAVLFTLLPAWEEAVASRVARLDGATNSLTVPEATSLLARVLGATPNPSDLVIRAASDDTEALRQAWSVAVIVLGILTGPVPAVAARLAEDLPAARSLEAQIAAIQNMVDDIGAAGAEAIDFAERYLLEGETVVGDDGAQVVRTGLLYAQRARAAPFLALGPDRSRVTLRVGASGEPPLTQTSFDETATVWSAPLVDGDVAGWLATLLTEAQDPTQPAPAPAEPAPLLFQLLKRAIAVVHADDRAALISGLTTLVTAAGDGSLPDPVADLETLLGETLGTCMHRVDAWLSGYAAARLDSVRALRPDGIQVGGYGWVVGLRPAGNTRPSQGFIHTPSLDHAATAAILRSGWNTFGGSDGAGLAVDVSSDRARRAAWIVDGLQDGQRLAELLGQSLERHLHDARLDAHVAPIRRLVLDATRQPGRPANTIVDGYLVARAWLGPDQSTALTGKEEAVRVALLDYVARATADASGVRTVLDAHATDLDAVADTGLTQAVYAIVRGSPLEASAALDGISGGDAGPVALTALRSTRGGRQVNHRLLLMFDAVEIGSTGRTPDAMVAPELDSWLATTLPLDQVVYGAWVTDDGRRSWQGPFTLADSGLGPLEVLQDLPSVPELGFGPLAARLAWPLRRAAADAGRVVTVEIDADAGGAVGPDRLALRLFIAAAQSLSGCLRCGRAANPADLADPATATPDRANIMVARAARLRVAAAVAADRVRAALASSATLVDDLAALAAWHVPDATPVAGLVDVTTPGGDDADREALLGQARAALSTMDERLAAEAALAGDDLATALARVQLLLPGAIVLPPFVPANRSDLVRSARRSPARLGGAAAALGWLAQVGRVREQVGTAAAAVDLVEATGARRFDPVLVQLPDHAEEPWAATGLPHVDTRPRTCLLALTWPASPSERWCGLVVDSWTDVIPDRRSTSGLAVHFDAPGARAPQSLLLALPPFDAGWSFDEVQSVVTQTLTRARQRAVGPDEVDGFGQYLPATYLGDDADGAA